MGKKRRNLLLIITHRYQTGVNAADESNQQDVLQVENEWKNPIVLEEHHLLEQGVQPAEDS